MSELVLQLRMQHNYSLTLLTIGDAQPGKTH